MAFRLLIMVAEGRKNLEKLLESQSKNTTEILVYDKGTTKPITEEEFEKMFGVQYLRRVAVDSNVPDDFFDFSIQEALANQSVDRNYNKIHDKHAMEARIEDALDSKGEFWQKFSPTELRYLYPNFDTKIKERP